MIVYTIFTSFNEEWVNRAPWVIMPEIYLFQLHLFLVIYGTSKSIHLSFSLIILNFSRVTLFLSTKIMTVNFISVLSNFQTLSF